MSHYKLTSLPKNWAIMKLRDVILDIQPGFACGKRDNEGFIQLRMNNIGLEGKIVTDSLLKVPKSETNIQKYKLKKGDIIFNNTNSPELVGKTAIFNDEIKDCVYSNHLTRIRVKNDIVLPEYVTNFLRFEQKKGVFELLCRRFVGQASIPKETLLNLDLLIPSIEEQKQIIIKIEGLFCESKIVKEMLEKVGPILKKFRQSILTNAFNGKLTQENSNNKLMVKLSDEVTNQKNNDSQIESYDIGNESIISNLEKMPELPKGWIWNKIGDIAKVGQGGTPSRTIIEYWNGYIPWIRSGEVNNNIIYDSREKITKRGLEESSTALCPKGTVLLAMTGEGITRGRSGILAIDACINQSVAYMIVDDTKIIPWYLYYYLRSQYHQIRRIEKGTNQAGINTTIVKKIVIPLAPFEEQKKIISKIEELFSIVDNSERFLFESRKLIEKIDNSILAKAFRGELTLKKG